MKKLKFFAVALLVIVPLIAFAGDRVRGHWRDTNRDGVKDTYVNSYERTPPNSSRTDNYSYPGHYNPNRGEITPNSSSPRDTYPSNPNPYDRRKY